MKKNLIKEKIENKILPFIEKPERYIGEEVKSLKRTPEGKTTIALAFPDVYEVGFSNIGLKILYHIVNLQEHFLAERLYAPWLDYEELLRKENIPLTSVDSFTPMSEFDIIGFTLQHELSYTNIINMLDLGKIPLYSKDRDEKYPLIIAGGPGAFNPSSMEPFIDLFVPGDGEEVILEILETYNIWKKEQSGKDDLLKRLVKIHGIYIPSFYETIYEPSGLIKEIKPLLPEAPEVIEKRIVKDLDKVFYPQDIMLPLMEIIHDRAVIELFRGCTRGCRFCQAGYIYRPVRERSPQTCLEQAKNLIKNTGYADLSLSSLSTTDYSSIELLIKNLMKSSEASRVSISLPSMRIDTFSAELAHEVQKVRKTGFTFAPEAGSERLRRVINKQVTEEDLLKTVESALSNGWQRIKLYFMIGLPTETYDDLQETVNLVQKVVRICERYRYSGITISFSSFVPKPHTPFQWEKQDGIKELKEKQDWLFNNLKGKRKNKKLFINFHNTNQSFLEAILARGDRKLGDVILKAWSLGCRFDNWSDQFKFNLWEEAFKTLDVSPEFYTARERSFDEIMPWDHISSGIKKEFLIEEKEKSLTEEKTIDCRFSSCSNCGTCEALKAENVLYKSDYKEPAEIDGEEKKEEEKMKIRFHFTKNGNMKFISHLGLLRIMERAIRATGSSVDFSQGFNPTPKISLGPPLSSGVESICEFGDVVLTEKTDPSIFAEKVSNCLPEGMKIVKASEIPLKSDALNAIIKVSVYEIEAIINGEFNEDKIKNTLEDILNKKEILFKKVRKKMSRIIDIRPLITMLNILSMEKEKILLELWLKFDEKGTIKPQEVVEILSEDGINMKVINITRKRLLTEEHKEPL